MPRRIRVCRDVYEYAETYTSMPKYHTICKDSPLELIFREFRIVRIDPSRHSIIDAENLIQPSFIWCNKSQKQLENVTNIQQSGFGDICLYSINSFSWRVFHIFLTTGKRLTGLIIGSLASWTQLVDPWTQLLKTTKIDYICKESIKRCYCWANKKDGGLWRQAPYF